MVKLGFYKEIVEMRWEVQETMESLKALLQEGKLEDVNVFFDETEWEDEYSHNEIQAFQFEFLNQAKDYLDKNAKGRYIVRYGVWCVHVFTKEYYIEKIKKEW